MRPLPFAVAVQREADRAVVVVEGEIDLATVDQIREALGQCDEGDVILDLGAVSFLDTSALRLFVEQQRAADARGGRFALANLSPTAARLLDIAGLRDRLELVDERGNDQPAG